MNWKTILWNIFFASLISWTGGIGILITRIAKGNWTRVSWSYIPIFWIPVLFSWPVGVAALVGMFD
jgi:hypothetical protein